MVRRLSPCRFVRSFFAAVLALAAVSLSAGAAPARGAAGEFSYGDAWWSEYGDTGTTSLLVHFGPPKRQARQELAEKVQEKKDDAGLSVDPGDLDEMDTSGDLGGITIESADLKAHTEIAPVDEANVPAGHVPDYSRYRRVLKLPPGMAVVEGGRFGKGIQASGGAGLKIDTSEDRSGHDLGRAGVDCVEGWFKFEKLPTRTQCLFSINNDEGRVLLHPDGRIELKLKHPHCKPYGWPGLKEKVTEAQMQRVLARDAEIISEPQPAGQWIHVVVYNEVYGAPGYSPWSVNLKINGEKVDSYLANTYNNYQHWMGRPGPGHLVVANSAAGDAGFVGWVDEFRATSVASRHYTRQKRDWTDPEAERKLRFGRPWFRQDGLWLHASLDKGLTCDTHRGGVEAIDLNLRGLTAEGLEVPGIRGKGRVIDPAIGRPKFSLKGLEDNRGALEFWLRPVNWDDMTGGFQAPPNPRLTVAEFFGRDRKTGRTVKYLTARLSRFHGTGERVPLDPGHWTHLAVAWNPSGARVHLNGGKPHGVRFERGVDPADIEPLYVQLGVAEDVKVKRGERPLIEIDEVVAYNYPIEPDEVAQAHDRWRTDRIDPIKLYVLGHDYKHPIGKLTATLHPRLPGGQVPRSARMSLLNLDAGEKVVRGPIEEARHPDNKRFDFLLNASGQLPYARYAMDFELLDAEGKVLLADRREWNFQPEPWRDNKLGILDTAPAPWTPIQLDGRTVKTRMTAYELGSNGLPVKVFADGENILARPFQILEDGQPMAAEAARINPSRDVEIDWSTRFTGRTCDIVMHCRMEYDGMIRYELDIQPKGDGQVAPVAFVMPVRKANATHTVFCQMGSRVSTGTIDPNAEGVVLSSRTASGSAWRDYRKQKKSNRDLTWDDFHEQWKDQRRAYGLFAHLNVNDRNRGLWWFCDNGRGWHQSKTIGACQLVRDGDELQMVLNLLAEPVKYESKDPIVFGLMAHPARPVPETYRLIERCSPEENDWASSQYGSVFKPWVYPPTAGEMKVFPPVKAPVGQERDWQPPATRSEQIEASWKYAESCVPAMKDMQPTGTRTLYLSKWWLSCRAGQYDGWAWRSGPSGNATMTTSFVDYLCWEMNEWIGRGIYDAVYLDETYETRALNLEAGFGCRLPDGSVQPGIDNFGLRELLKRWRNLFTAHGVRPALLSHNTRSFAYHAHIFCESWLDGENSPIVALGSQWLDRTSKQRMENLQNGRMWGLGTFWMPYISEGGFKSEDSQFPKWQWRQARQAQSQFAHYETATVYEGQGAGVYRRYWNDVLGWGAGDPDKVPFHAYWNNAPYLAARRRELAAHEIEGTRPEGPVEHQWVPGHTGKLLVSFYRKSDSGALLMIVSNHTARPVLAEIELNAEKLPLPDGAKARSLDSTFNPPPGPDYEPAKARKESKELIEDTESILDMGLDDGGMGADLGEIAEMVQKDPARDQRRKELYVPRLDGRTVKTAIRARDYRVIVIE